MRRLIPVLLLACLLLWHGLAFAQQPPGSQCVSQAIAGGTADALTVPQLPCTATSTLLVLKLSATNVTSAPTLQQIGVSAPQVILSSAAGALAPGALAQGSTVVMSYNGTNWFVLAGLGSGISAAGQFTPEAYGAVADGGNGIGVTLAAGSPVVGGITFPPAAVGKPFICYGCAANGTTLVSTVLGAQTISSNAGATVVSYDATRAYTSSAGGTNLANDIWTVTGGSCSLAPQFTVQWVDGPYISLSVTRSGSCTVLPQNPVTVTSSGGGTGLQVNIIWENTSWYVAGIYPLSVGGTGFQLTDQLGVSGATCSVPPVLQPTSLGAGGSITGLKIVTPGVCSTFPGTVGSIASATLTGGSGTGASWYLAWNPAGYYAYGTDNEAALQRLVSAVQAAGGSGTVQLANNGNYAVHTSTPISSGTTDFIMSWAGMNGLTINGNGAKLIDARQYDGTNGTYTWTFTGTGIVLNGLTAVEAQPLNHLLGGMHHIALGTTTDVVKDVLVVNPVLRNGGGDVLASGPLAGGSRTRGITILGGESLFSEYGYNAANNGDDVTIKGFSCFSCGRVFFIYGVRNYDAQVSSQNALIQDVFIPTRYASNNDTTGVKLSYTVPPRVAGEVNENAYLLLDSGHGNVGGTLSGFDISVDIDERGESVATAPAILCVKDGLANAQSTWSNIRISGTIRNVQNLAGTLINCPASTDSQWSNEQMNTFTFNNLIISGSSTPTEFSDLGGFSSGPFAINDTLTAGTWSLANLTASNFSGRNANLGGTTYYTNCALVGGSAIPTQAAPAANTTTYWGGVGYQGGFTNSPSILLPSTGVLRNLSVTLDTAPGNTFTDVATVHMVSGDTALTCSIANAATSCLDNTHSVALTPSLVAALKFVIPAGGQSTGLAWTAQVCTP